MNQQSENRDSAQRKKGSFPSSALLMGLAAILLLAAVTLLIPSNLGTPAPSASQPPADRAASGNALRVAEGCELVQTLSYTRCEHSITRRVAAPTELYGKTLQEVQPLYEEWQITEFAPKEIKMSQQPDIYCPDHMVLMPNETGLLCVFQNKYGDALALVEELQTEVSALPSAMQEEVRRGIGFATLAELEQWLESAES
ncbi:MAG: hypothetical protein VB099_04985 [Candidatus Limiplasma sp.]|nr:hypothetical protein [Candidatus Limiplasma sp.]